MNIPQERKLSAPRMFVFITRVEDEKKLEGILHSMHIPIFYQCRGQGTAPSEIMDIFGLGGTTRLITIGLLPKCAIHDLFEKNWKTVFFSSKRGRNCHYNSNHWAAKSNVPYVER